MDLVGKFFKKPIEKKWEIPEELKKPILEKKVEVEDY